MADANDTPFLERAGLAFFQRRSAVRPPLDAADDVHTLNPDELRALRRIHAGTVLRAAIAGALSGLVAALAELLAEPLSPGPAASLVDHVPYYAVVFGIAGVASVLEVGFLYWDSLRSVHELARAAGLRLFDGEASDSREVAAALARAALELPSPPRAEFAVNPLRESSRAVLLGAALLYKLKVGLTSFLLKAIVRRIAGRAAVRAWLVFVAVPVTAMWNAIVAHVVMREARIRAMGPSAASAFARTILEGAQLSPEGRLAALRAVGSNIVRSQTMHPNLVAFMRAVHRHVGDADGALDDTALFLASLRSLAPAEQDVVLRLLCAGAVLDARVSRRERRLVTAAFEACNRQPRLDALARLHRAFTSGKPEMVELARATVP